MCVSESVHCSESQLANFTYVTLVSEDGEDDEDKEREKDEEDVVMRVILWQMLSYDKRYILTVVCDKSSVVIKVVKW